jgi:hypothetical protein
MMLSGLTIAPAMPAPGASAAEVEKAVATPMAVSRDTVRIRNNNGFHIDVTARLLVSGSIKPTISRRIGPNGATDTFSFGRHANDFIQVELRRVGGQTPPPFTTTLNQPIGGYYGKLFTVSEFGGRFNVSL